MENDRVRKVFKKGRILVILLISISSITAQANTKTSSSASSQVGITFQKGSRPENPQLVDEGSPSPSSGGSQNASKKRLPKTGEEKSSKLGFLGLLLLMLFGWVLINGKRNGRKNENKK